MIAFAYLITSLLKISQQWKRKGRRWKFSTIFLSDLAIAGTAEAGKAANIWSNQRPDLPQIQYNTISFLLVREWFEA